MPSWSPDGKQLTCHTYAGPQTIIVMNADGSGRETIINHWGSPRWSPRGNRIASIGAERGISLYDLATGKERNILAARTTCFMALASRPTVGDMLWRTDGGVYLATLDEPTMKAMCASCSRGREVDHSSWSPTAARSSSLEATQRDETVRLYFMDMDIEMTGPTLLRGQDPDRHNTNPDWSPDGKTIIFAAGAGLSPERVEPSK